MTLEKLQAEMVSAMKNKDKNRKDAISSMISAVKKAAIDKKIRENIPESLVDEVILKEKKTVQEMIDTCPQDRIELSSAYKARLAVIEEFAPKLMTDSEEIKSFIIGIGIEISNQNRGKIMGQLKGKADMKVANQVLGGML